MEDTPIDTVAAVYSLQLSIADFVFLGLHLLIPDNNSLLDITSRRMMEGEGEGGRGGREREREKKVLFTGRPCCQQICLSYEVDTGE